MDFAVKLQKILERLGNLLVALFKVIFISKKGLKVPLAQNEKVVILATGPSMKYDLSKIDLSNTDYFCVNFFGETPEFYTLKPNNLVLVDPAFFMNNTIKKALEERVNLFFEKIYSQVDWPLTLYIPVKFKQDFQWKINRSNLGNTFINIVCYNSINVNGKGKFYHLLYKNNLAMPSPNSVTVAAIFLALNAGYKSINLVGVDHDFHRSIVVNKENKVIIAMKHFYDNQEAVSYLPFLNSEGVNFSVAESFLIFHKIFNSYTFISDYAKNLGVKIINYSENSFIDNFDRA